MLQLLDLARNGNDYYVYFIRLLTRLLRVGMLWLPVVSMQRHSVASSNLQLRCARPDWSLIDPTRRGRHVIVDAATNVPIRTLIQFTP
jgi:hypothetical protein